MENIYLNNTYSRLYCVQCIHHVSLFYQPIHTSASFVLTFVNQQLLFNDQSLCDGCFQKVDCYVCALDFFKITASLKQRSCVILHSPPFITRHPTVILIFQSYHPIESIPIEQWHHEEEWHITDSYVCTNPLILMKWWWRRTMGGILRIGCLYSWVLKSFFTYEHIIPMGGSVE